MKRLAIVALWGYTFWGLGSYGAAMLSIPDVLGPLIGVGTAVFVMLDPTGHFWGRSFRSESDAPEHAIASPTSR